MELYKNDLPLISSALRHEMTSRNHVILGNDLIKYRIPGSNYSVGLVYLAPIRAFS